MPPREGFEVIRRVVSEEGIDEPLTAREILALAEEHDADFDSAHAVATVLGRHAERGEVEVVEDRPYRYRLDDRST